MDPSWVQPAGVYLPFPIKNGVELDINEKAVVAAVIFNRFCKMRKPITPQYVAGTCEHFVWELVNYEGPDEVFEKHIPEINQSNLTLIVDCLKREFESSQDAKLQPKSVDPNRKTAVENAIKAINPERLNPTHKAIQNYLKKKGGSGMNTGMLTRILDELRLEDKYKGPSRSRKNDL